MPISALEEQVDATEGGVSAAHAVVARGAWLISAAATAFGGFLLWRFDIAVDATSMLLSGAVMIFLVAVSVVYGTLRPAPVLANLCGAVAVVSWSLAMAGIISLVGLHYRSPLIDTTLANADQWVGIDLPSAITWFALHPIWTDVLAVAYVSSFVQLFAMIAFLAATRRFDKLWQLAFVCSLTVIGSTTISVFLPAKGAFAYFDYPAELLDKLPRFAGSFHLAKFEYFRNASAPVLSFAHLQGVVTFPSFHCCLALMTIFAATGTGWLFGAALLWNALVIVSTIPIGGHFVVDLPGGALLWLIATVAAAMLRQRLDPATLVEWRMAGSASA